jgi:hypothetical protein
METTGLIFAALVVVVMLICLVLRAGKGWSDGSPLDEGRRRDFDFDDVDWELIR